MVEKIRSMKTAFGILFTVLISTGYGQAWDTAYVDQSRSSGNHDGSNWGNAYQTIDEALEDRISSDSLVMKIAQGTYYPLTPPDTGRYLISKCGIKIIGGYPSMASETDLPDPDNNPTIISGDIDRNDTWNLSDSTYVINGNNSRSVLKIRSNVCIELYGIWIVCGMGGQIQHILRPEYYNGKHYLGGAGLYIEAAGKCSIKKCKFISNTSESTGGAISFTGQSCEFSIDSSFFKNNESQFPLDNSDPQDEYIHKIGGGAIYARSTYDLRISNSVFKNCIATNAGGAINFHSYQDLIIQNCLFTGNTAGSEGGAIYNLCAGNLILLDSIGKNIFTSNTARNGGAVFIRNFGYIEISGAIFRNNIASDSGGAVCVFAVDLKIEKSFFENDSADRGGACFAYVIYSQFDSDTFTQNHVASDGGAVFLGTSTGSFRSNIYEGNTAKRNGGAIFGGAIGDIVFSSVSFLNNNADNGGGAICLDKGNFICNENSNFSNNSADYGGALSLLNLPYHGLPNCTIEKVTFDNNHAQISGGVLHSDHSMNYSKFSLSKMINNSADSTGAVCKGYNGKIDNCLIANNTTGNGNVIHGDIYSGSEKLNINFCTIADNIAGPGMSAVHDAELIENSIIWNECIPFQNCDQIRYSIFEGEISDSTNLAMDPRFLRIGSYPYSISYLSPAIDAADPESDTIGQYYDLAGKIRKYRNRMDIGAYEYSRDKIYVDSRAIGNNTGYSWPHAFRKLEDAIAIAVPGDSIWVATGTYYPTEGNDRYKSFKLYEKQNITILGGFAGNETSATQRNSLLNPTVLSGDIGVRGIQTDNSYHVLFFWFASDITIDGFKITSGYADNLIGIDGPGTEVSGGGMRIESTNGVVIRDCDFVSNVSYTDGAGCSFTETGDLVMVNCSFRNNHTIDDNPGTATGALSVHNCGTVSVRGCTFYNNSSRSGRSSALDLKRCAFEMLNTSFYNNLISGTPTYSWAFDSCTVNIRNCVLWNPGTSPKEVYLGPQANLVLSNNIIKNSLSGIDSAGGTLVPTDITGNNPNFIDAASGNLSLSINSPCIDRGTVIDTTGWSTDINKNPRIYNGTIDLGACEFQGVAQPDAPILLSTLDRFEIKANGSISLDLNRRNPDGSGYYALYFFRDISELTWQAVSTDTNVAVSLSPDSNKLSVSISSYRPGDSFAIRLRAADPVYTQAAAEKNVRFTVVSPVFEICNATVVQNQYGRDFSGRIEVKRTIDPITLVRDRIYLGDDIGTPIDRMQFITGIIINESVPPLSRGGDTECGLYEFAFNATEAIVYNANGTGTGKTLLQWATDSTSRYPGSLYYKSHNSLKLILPVSNGIDETKWLTKIVPSDFNVPLTRIQVRENRAHQQKIIWNAFTEPLENLTLLIIPEGDGAPEPDTVEFDSSNINVTFYTTDSIQDSRTYRYVLLATDAHGNTGESQVSGTTPSGFYTISGEVRKYHVPIDTSVHVLLYSIDTSGVRNLIRDTLVQLDSPFVFGNVVNGIYEIAVQSGNKYFSAPTEVIDTVLRENVSGIQFQFMPEAVISANGVRVEQIEGTGDLAFTVKTNGLFYEEKPVRIYLRWEGGDSTVDTGSQVLSVPSDFTQTLNPDGSAIWQFTITRETIQDSILFRKSGFDINVRYYNSEIETEAFGYQTFRKANWAYPEQIGNRLLFAGQIFRKPEPPLVTTPIASINDASFVIRNRTPGPGEKAIVKFEHHETSHVVEREYDAGNTSMVIMEPPFNQWIVRPLNWNYTSSYSVDPMGRAFLSGIVIDSISADSATFRHQNGFIVPGQEWVPGTPASTSPYASWKISIPEDGSYWAWIHIDRPASVSDTVFISFGEINYEKKYAFTVPQNKTGWQKIYVSNAENPDFRNTLPLLSKGETNVNLFFPTQDISVSGLVLKKKTASEKKEPHFDTNMVSRVFPWGASGPVKASSFNLIPDSRYRLTVCVRDRYGNTSEPVVFDTVKTYDNLFENKIAIHEKPGTGNLAITLQEIDSNALFLDSVIFRFDGQDYPLDVHRSLNRTGYTEIELTREELDTIIPNSKFQRHTVYDSLFLVFASDTEWVESSTSDLEGNCDGVCTDTAHDDCLPGTITQTRRVLFFFEKRVTKSICQYTRTDTLKDTIWTPRIPAAWPAGNEYQVSSQEYREVTNPVLDSVETTSRSIKLSCTNLNTLGSGGIKEQMSGSLHVIWEPGSVCKDTSVINVPFGNRFTMADNWIAFIPSFEGALNSNVGMWRQMDSLGARHQWIDRFNPGNPLLGGEFFPNIGYTVSKNDVAVNTNLVPSISMGINLTAEQASSGSADKFKLWVLPSKINGDGSHEFYWGIDGIPDTVTIGDALNYSSSPVWLKGPEVLLDSGDHSIDLFMKDDGVGIAAIALSKDTAYPPVSPLSLSRWGNSGFDLEIHATDLPSNHPVKFTYQAVDRFGNVSDTGELTIITKASDEPVPDVVITPDIPLENGIYRSIYPSFTISTAQPISDTLTLETRLKLNHSGSSDSVSLLNVVLVDSAAHIWNVSVDSTAALQEFPDSGGVSIFNGYSLQARAITQRGVPGNWTQLVFGVRADTSEIPPSVTLLDSIYEIPSLVFKYQHGIQISNNILEGDLEVVFDFDNTTGKKLMLEGATIFTHDSTGSVGEIIHVSIDSIQGGKLACYECDDYSYNCSRSSIFSFPYGRFTIETSADSLSIHSYADGKKIRSPLTLIRDDNDNKARLSASSEPGIPVPITRKGIIDSCYVTQDRFFLENVLTFGTVHPGFHIDACKVAFSRDTLNDSYSMLTYGQCASCGPDLKFAVVSPRYLDEEFSVFDPLQEPVALSYTGTEQEYQIDFSSGSNHVAASQSDTVNYMGWKLDINSYTFGSAGITLDDFGIKIHEETFPADKNSGNTFVNGFRGALIKGTAGNNDGALHLVGTAAASGENVTICSANDYKFSDIDSLKFITQDDYSFQMTIPEGCNLKTPSWNSGEFNEEDTIVVSVHPDTGFVLGNEGLIKVNASGPFERTIGTRNYVPTFRIRGNLGITYAARDFQLKVTQRENVPLFQLSGAFFMNNGDLNDSVNISQASIGIFSDFTINTLYGKKEDGNYSVHPAQFSFAGIPSSGFDIFKTSADSTAGIRVLLLAPEFELGGLNDLMNLAGGEDACSTPSPTIYNAGFDLNGRLTNISGRIDLPENLLRCFGLNGMEQITQNVASFKMKSIYLGYEENEDEFTIGADATLEFGKIFDPIGLMGEKIKLDKVTAGYKEGSWSLKEMHASAFPLPRLIGIGPKNFGNSAASSSKYGQESGTRVAADSLSGINYVELYTGGKGFSLDYDSDSLVLDFRNWSLRLTDRFPVEQLRGISFLLDSLRYVKGRDGNGRITALSAAGVWSPPGGVLSFGDVGLYNTRITLGCEPDPENSTNLSGYLSLEFDSLKIGNKMLHMSSEADPDCRTGFKIFFDGNYSASGCIVWRDTIGIVPWGEEHNPDIFIDPGQTGCSASFRFDSRTGFSAGLKNVHLRSKDTLDVIDTILAVDINDVRIACNTSGKFCLETLDVSWLIYKKVMDNDAFKLVINQIDFGYNNGKRTSWGSHGSLSDKFWIIASPKFEFKLSKHCDEVNLTPSLGLVVNTNDSDPDIDFVWMVDGRLNCNIGGFGFGADFVINRDTIGFANAFLDMQVLKDFGVLDENNSENSSNFNARPENIRVGVEFEHVYWVKRNGKWEFAGLSKDNVHPTFSYDQPFDICGIGVVGTFNFSRLFDSPYPGIGYENIKLRFSENLGGAEVPLNLSLYLDGRKPFLHPEYNKPNKFVLAIPAIKLTDDIQLGEARMEIGVDRPENLDYETWYFRGVCSMKLSPALDNITVDIAFEKPHPWENITGIRHAKVKVKLGASCRIPLGSTPFYIAGFEGALYDGSGVPEGAIACHLPTMPPGLKVEAAILLEFQEPTVVSGKLGFWVHLYQLNFGVNGEVIALEGIADAEACAALYNNGTAFHGHFLAYVHLGLSSKGRFTIDMWRDETGGNFTADALASIGLSRGSLIKRKFIKIPTKDKWFLELFTKAGKFQNNNAGLTTGLRFFGKTWGLGIINSKFKIGDLGKYKLKQSPVVVPGGDLGKRRASGLAKTGTGVTNTLVNPGFILEGGEVISLVAATDSSSYEWPMNVLRVADAYTMEVDNDTFNYIPLEGRGTDTVKTYFLEEENTVARLWVNNNNYDSILIYVPDSIRKYGTSQLPPHGGFEYLFFAGLKPARFSEMSAQPETRDDTLKVTFKGTISDFQGHIRNIERKTPENTYDTLLRQKMDFKLYCSAMGARASDTLLDTVNYLYNFIEIPISQFEGYQPGHKSLLENPNVTYNPGNRVLSFENLVWNTSKFAPGKYALRAAVEITDFVVQDENGVKTILPDSLESEASVYRDDPVVLGHPGVNDTVIIYIDNRFPITKPTGFAATGSAADTNWAGENENRSIFLRWNMDDNPGVNGYRITWYPSSDSSLKRTEIVGKTDHFTITIPDYTGDSTLYTDDSTLAEGIVELEYDTTIEVDTFYISSDSSDYTKIDTLNDSTFVYKKAIYDYDTTLAVTETRIIRPNRMCPRDIDTAYYKSNRFDIIITPVVNTIYTLPDSLWVNAPGRPRTVIKADIVSDTLSDTIRNVFLGHNRGEDANSFSIDFKVDSAYTGTNGKYNGRPIEVPLNTGTVVNAKVAVENRSEAIDPSRYGELWVRVKNDNVPGNAMPRGGAFDNYFTIDDDTLFTSVSFRPIEKSMTCREMFGSTCSKRKVDSSLVLDTNTFESCTSGCFTFPNTDSTDSCSTCDPNAAGNQLALNDPCNGRPDSLLYRRSPFEIYKLYLYAVNNGQRIRPVPDSIPGPVVYDSLLFRVVPPKPVLHGISPSYILYGRNDTLSLAVSKLWIDTSSVMKPSARLRWEDESGLKQTLYIPLVSGTNILPMRASEENRDWKLETSADWEVRVPTSSVYVATTGETWIDVAIVNKAFDVNGDSVQSVSNEFKVAYVYNPNEIECPDSYYDPDSANASYLMDWIGNYPSDQLSPGGIINVRFTELHDLNPAHYSVKLLRDRGGYVDTTHIDSFKIDYSGIQVKLPASLAITSQREYRLVVNYDSAVVSNCWNKHWGSSYSNAFSVVPERNYDIVKYGNGFRIIVTNPEGKPYRNLDRVRYSIGRNTFANGMVTNGYDHRSNPPQFVELFKSSWVTAYIEREGNAEQVEKWIEIENIPQLIYTDGTPVPDNFIAEPGDTLIIQSPITSIIEPTETRPFHCYRFSDGPVTCRENVIILIASSHGPLTIERWAETQPGQQGGYRKSLEGFRTYNFTLKTYQPNEIAGIIIPSQRILDAASRNVDNYPLLLRLDTTIVPGLNTILSGPFHFRDVNRLPIPFEIEHMDSLNNKADVWVRLSKIDPGIGNNTVYLVSGSPANNSHQVWSDYRAVWHFSNKSTITDATGKGYNLIASAAAENISGVIQNSLIPSGTLSLSASDNQSIISNNDAGFTISAWVKLNSITDSPARLFNFISKTGSSVCGLSVLPDSGLAFYIGSDTVRTIAGAVEESVWLHIAASYHWYMSSGNAVVYVNGLPVARKDRVNNGARIEGVASMLLCDGFAGIIDEMRIAPKALSYSAISLDYYSQRKRADFLKVPSGLTSITSISNPGSRLIPGSKNGDYLSTGNDQWKISSLPIDLVGKTWLLMPWAERASESDSLVKIAVNGSATVYVLLDNKYITRPPFLSGYTKTGQTVIVEGPLGSTGQMDVYSRTVDSASTLTFGGPSQGGIRGGELPWAVLLDCVRYDGQIRVAAGPYPYVRTGKAENGELLFSDRECEIDSLSSEFKDGILVKMPNAYRFSDTSSILSLSVNRTGIANLLLDTSYSSWPSFITGDRHWHPLDKKVVADGRIYSVLRKKISPEDTLELGGPRIGEGEGNRSMYALILQPDDDSVLKVIKPKYCTLGMIDTGVVPYVDSLWHIVKLPANLKNLIMIKTRQSDFALDDSAYLSIDLKRSSWVYIAIDEAQSLTPEFLRTYDPVNGRWERTHYTIETSSKGVYRVYRIFMRNGLYTLPSARSNGSDDNLYNYFVLVDTSRISITIPTELDSTDTASARIGVKPFKANPEIVYISPELEGVTIVIDSILYDYCKIRSFTVDQPVRIWLGMDPAFRSAGTFISREGWERTGTVISLSHNLADRVVFQKEFRPGRIEIPGVNCDYPQPGVTSPIIFIEYLEAPSRGLITKNLKAAGFGDERFAQTENYIVQNMDVIYAWDIGMESRSWKMNVEARSATANPGDTLIILSPFTDDTILSINDSMVVREGNRFYLPDLLPGLVAADSVVVNAIDLTARGAVRIGINNRSDIPVNTDFIIVLFEDMDGDFNYSRNKDRRLGSAIVRGIGANEIRLYQISIDDTLSFPKRAICAFVDANEWVIEHDEWNNVRSSGTSCEGFTQKEYFEVQDNETGMIGDWGSVESLTSGLPEFRDTAVFCYLTDFNRDSSIDEIDTLCVVYTFNNRLYAINALTRDSLFPSMSVNALNGMNLRVDDLTNDGKPEIISGNALYSNTGELIYDFSVFTQPDPEIITQMSFDFNSDGDRDSIAFAGTDSCVTIWSGRDSSLIFVCPANRWTGPFEAAVGTLAEIEKGEFYCYDANVSFPRYSVVSGDTVDLTVRLANSGAYSIHDFTIEVYADSSSDTGTIEMHDCTKLADSLVTGRLESQKFKDIRFTTALPDGTKRLWFIADSSNRYFECNEKDNVIELRIE